MKLQQLIQSIEKQQFKPKLLPLKIGDTVRVKLNIKENNKTRIQPCEGIIIAQHRAGINTTITVRRIFQNIGVERVFSIHSPLIESIEIIRRAQVRKAKLYYLRDRIGKSTRLKERFDLGKSLQVKENSSK